jgi:hypothetical protein
LEIISVVGCDGAGWAIAELQAASVNPNIASNADFIVAPARPVNDFSQPDWILNGLKSELPSKCASTAAISDGGDCKAGKPTAQRMRLLLRY